MTNHNAARSVKQVDPNALRASIKQRLIERHSAARTLKRNAALSYQREVLHEVCQEFQLDATEPGVEELLAQLEREVLESEAAATAREMQEWQYYCMATEPTDWEEYYRSLNV